jgi:hypothetical protein
MSAFPLPLFVFPLSNRFQEHASIAHLFVTIKRLSSGETTLMPLHTTAQILSPFLQWNIVELVPARAGHAFLEGEVFKGAFHHRQVPIRFPLPVPVLFAACVLLSVAFRRKRFHPVNHIYQIFKPELRCFSINGKCQAWSDGGRSPWAVLGLGF